MVQENRNRPDTAVAAVTAIVGRQAKKHQKSNKYRFHSQTMHKKRKFNLKISLGRNSKLLLWSCLNGVFVTTLIQRPSCYLLALSVVYSYELAIISTLSALTSS